MMRYLAIGWLVFLGLVVCVGLGAAIYEGWPDSAVFEVTHVFRIPLRYVLSDCFEQEGCKSVQELMDIWNNIHPVTGIMPDQIVYAHIFQMVQP